MKEPSRRSVLAGAGSAIALGTAGCIGTPGTDAADDADERSLPHGLADALAYVFPPEDGGPVLRIQRPGASERNARSGYHSRLEEAGDLEWVVVTSALDGESGFVATGSFDVDEAAEDVSPDGSHGAFDRYRMGGADAENQLMLATDGETACFGDPEWVRSTLESADADEPTYLESTEGVRSLLSLVDYEGRASLVDEDAQIRRPFEQLEVDAERYPERLLAHIVRSEDSVSYTLAGWYAELPGEDPAAGLESYLSTQLEPDDVATEVREDEGIVVARGSRPYTPPEERPETAGVPRFYEYDAAAGELLFRFGSGDQLPVDRYEIEIDDEVYEGEWARGQEEIGEGSVVAIDEDAIEPGDQLTVSYESPNGGYGSSTGTTALRNLPFVLDFDPNDRSGELRYVEGPPLDADRLSVTVAGGSDEEDVRRPWSGDVTSGDAVTLADLGLEGHVLVRYERNDGETIRVGGASYGPPGRFAFEYDGRAETLTIRYPDLEERVDNRPRPGMGHRPEQEPLAADGYEITVDGDLADRQWTDAGEEIAPGDTLTLEGVPVDTNVSVAWIDADDTPHTVASTHTVPDVEFEYEYDAETDELTVTHAGGQAVDPSKLALGVHADDERTVAWDGEGEVTEGDDRVIDDVAEHGVVVVTYADQHLDYVHVAELREE